MLGQFFVKFVHAANYCIFAIMLKFVHATNYCIFVIMNKHVVGRGKRPGLNESVCMSTVLIKVYIISAKTRAKLCDSGIRIT